MKDYDFANADSCIKALKDDDKRMRSYAAESLGILGDERAVEPLIESLKDKDSWVRSCAARSLVKLGERRAVEALIEALKDDDDEDEWV